MPAGARGNSAMCWNPHLCAANHTIANRSCAHARMLLGMRNSMRNVHKRHCSIHVIGEPCADSFFAIVPCSNDVNRSSSSQLFSSLSFSSSPPSIRKRVREWPVDSPMQNGLAPAVTSRHARVLVDSREVRRAALPRSTAAGANGRVGRLREQALPLVKVIRAFLLLLLDPRNGLRPPLLIIGLKAHLKGLERLDRLGDRGELEIVVLLVQ
mmetsp:Transcript_9011/g.17599  ORF Transcript_9011/g.17599 Transcript_9011/m.17599 type:complete len:211 (+) Transcript_9011:270-902(+)